MTNAQAVESAIWPESGKTQWRVYTILDAARNESIHPRVLSCPLPAACLYAGALAPELAAVAPYLIELRRDSPFTQDLLKDGWGDSWGVYLLSTATLEELRRHFRRFLRVKDETGKTMIFRYYDPRVLRSYLPTCNAEELAFIFGPVAMFVIESDQGRPVRYYRDDGKLQVAQAD